jgi:hypothetical protein
VKKPTPAQRCLLIKIRKRLSVFVWRLAELLQIKLPYPHIIFGWIVGVKGIKIKEKDFGKFD